MALFLKLPHCHSSSTCPLLTLLPRLPFDLSLSLTRARWLPYPVWHTQPTARPAVSEYDLMGFPEVSISCLLRVSGYPSGGCSVTTDSLECGIVCQLDAL